MNDEIESNGKLTISRSSCRQGDTVVIEIRDESGATVTAELNLSDYAHALLGLARTPCVVSASKLEHWGKTLLVEPRFVTIERIPGASKEDYSRWLRENMQEEDCELNCALTSQTSVEYSGDRVTLRYSVRKYV